MKNSAGLEKSGTMRLRQHPATSLLNAERLCKWMHVAFTIFLLIVLINISNGDADSADVRAGRAALTAAGDSTKQLTYLLMFLLFSGVWFYTNGLKLPRTLSVFQLAFMAWVFVSVMWSVEPDITFRRAILLLFVLFSTAAAIEMLGERRSVQSLYLAFTVCIITSLAAVPFFPFAMHQASEADQSLVGAWRGVFAHKNVAGGVVGMAIIFFLHHSITLRRKRDFAMLALSIVFFVFTKSKTPAGFLAIAIPLGLAYRMFMGNGLGRTAFIVSGIAILIFGGIVAATVSDEIYPIFTIHENFTGRVGIWQAALDYSKDHFWLGSGYSALWATVGTSPLAPYWNEGFQQFIQHSHNGYIDILGSTGIIGLTLALMAVLVVPGRQFFGDPRNLNVNKRAMFFSMWVFSLLENLMETQLYARDRELWTVMMTSILIVHLDYAKVGAMVTAANKNRTFRKAISPSRSEA